MENNSTADSKKSYASPSSLAAPIDKPKSTKKRTTRNSQDSEIIPPLEKEPRRQRAPAKPKTSVGTQLETINEPRTPVASTSYILTHGSPGVEELIEEAQRRLATLPENWQETVDDEQLASLFQEAPEFDGDDETLELSGKDIRVSFEFLQTINRFLKELGAYSLKEAIRKAREEGYGDEDLLEENKEAVENWLKQKIAQYGQNSGVYHTAPQSENEEEMSGTGSGGEGGEAPPATRGRRESMPSRTSRGAPVFDPTKPEELERYFDDLEECFTKAGLTSATARRPYIGKYAPISTENEWKNIEGWDTMSYADMKNAVMKEYPAAIAMKNGSIEKLNQICRENQRIGESDLAELLSFKRAFQVEAKKLQAPPSLLANHTLVAAFAKCLTPEFRERVYAKLDLTHSTDRLMDAWAAKNHVDTQPPAAEVSQRPEDRFRLEEVIKTAEEMARIRNPGSNLTQTRADVGVDFTVDRPRIKTEPVELGPLKQEIADIKNTVMGIKDAWVLSLREQASMQEQSTRKLFEEFKNSVYTTQAPAVQNGAPAPMRAYTPAPPTRQFVPRQPSMQNTCHYCQSPTHFADMCPFRKAHLEASKVVRHPVTGRLTFPDRSTIPYDEFKSTKDRVEEWHAKSKADKAIASLQGISPSPRMYAQNQQSSSGRSVRDARDDEIERLMNEVAQYRASSRPRVNSPSRESPQYQQTYEEYLQDERESTEAALQGLDSDYTQDFD